MGLKSRRPPKKGALKKTGSTDDLSVTTAASSSSDASVVKSLQELRMADEGPSAADKLSSEGIIATYSQVRESMQYL